MKNKSYLKIIAPFLILGFLFKSIIADWENVQSAINSVNKFYLLISFLVTLFIYPEGAYAWHVILKKMGEKISFTKTLSIWMISNTAKYIPGTIWQYVGRIELAKRKAKIGRATAGSSVAVEAMFALLAGAFLSLFVIGRASLGNAATYLIILIFPVILIILHPKVFIKLVSIAAKIVKKDIVINYDFGLQDAVEVLLLMIANFAINGFSFWILAAAFGISFSVSNLLLFTGYYTLSWVVGYVSLFAPGGVGVVEVTLAALLSTVMPFSLASVLALSYRFLLTISESVIFAFAVKLQDE